MQFGLVKSWLASREGERGRGRGRERERERAERPGHVHAGRGKEEDAKSYDQFTTFAQKFLARRF